MTCCVYLHFLETWKFKNFFLHDNHFLVCDLPHPSKTNPGYILKQSLLQFVSFNGQLSFSNCQRLSHMREEFTGFAYCRILVNDLLSKCTRTFDLYKTFPEEWVFWFFKWQNWGSLTYWRSHIWRWVAEASVYGSDTAGEPTCSSSQI